MHLAPYDRRAAVLYAHRWAYGRNPAFYDYENLGGDCTNFASQCIYVGSGVMNFTPTFGWYYIDANQKAPAWTGVPYLYNFLTREEQTGRAGCPPLRTGGSAPRRSDPAVFQRNGFPAFAGGGVRGTSRSAGECTHRRPQLRCR